eukprot:scaffold103659_cov50-Prasinocladus_malaysianus.AAC.1
MNNRLQTGRRGRASFIHHKQGHLDADANFGKYQLHLGFFAHGERSRLSPSSRNQWALWFANVLTPRSDLVF